MADDYEEALPLTDHGLRGSPDGKTLTLAVANEETACEVRLSQHQTASLALKMLDWLSRSSADAPEALQHRPLMALDFEFRWGRTPETIVLAVNLGAANLQIEIQREHLAASLGQLSFEPGEPPKPN